MLRLWLRIYLVLCNVVILSLVVHAGPLAPRRAVSLPTESSDTNLVLDYAQHHPSRRKRKLEARINISGFLNDAKRIAAGLPQQAQAQAKQAVQKLGEDLESKKPALQEASKKVLNTLDIAGKSAGLVVALTAAHLVKLEETTDQGKQADGLKTFDAVLDRHAEAFKTLQSLEPKLLRQIKKTISDTEDIITDGSTMTTQQRDRLLDEYEAGVEQNLKSFESAREEIYKDLLEAKLVSGPPIKIEDAMTLDTRVDLRKAREIARYLVRWERGDKGSNAYTVSDALCQLLNIIPVSQSQMIEEVNTDAEYLATTQAKYFRIFMEYMPTSIAEKVLPEYAQKHHLTALGRRAHERKVFKAVSYEEIETLKREVNDLLDEADNFVQVHVSNALTKGAISEETRNQLMRVWDRSVDRRITTATSAVHRIITTLRGAKFIDTLPTDNEFYEEVGATPKLPNQCSVESWNNARNCYSLLKDWRAGEKGLDGKPVTKDSANSQIRSILGVM
ncbi:hypothetical protein NUU61_003204 [Penicillium alfredii]|uniref:Uncharacterized protein n=1 Tax=Penicillium alfredii TaxID=1506179 RepID=A0A9W9KHY0_9EURO|nr:uncharacterized protein NUU61_003204 [Penicillium alfredii]KAJ5105857.1 hypothetical protein NUU61_003204 [Penicillium alfredii]